MRQAARENDLDDAFGLPFREIQDAGSGFHLAGTRARREHVAQRAVPDRRENPTWMKRAPARNVVRYLGPGTNSFAFQCLESSSHVTGCLRRYLWC